VTQLDKLFDFIGNRILQLCQRKDITVKALSKAIGKSNSYISNVVTNEIKIPAYAVQDICDYFGITMHEFFDESIIAPDLLKTAVDLLLDMEDRDLDALYVLIERMPKHDIRKV
jgi:transcriptional regulator with XRE-family HTH domain